MKLEQITGKILKEDAVINFEEIYQNVRRMVFSLGGGTDYAKKFSIQNKEKFEQSLNFSDLQCTIGIFSEYENTKIYAHQDNATYPGISGSLNDITVIVDPVSDHVHVAVTKNNAFLPNMVVGNRTSSINASINGTFDTISLPEILGKFKRGQWDVVESFHNVQIGNQRKTDIAHLVCGNVKLFSIAFGEKTNVEHIDGLSINGFTGHISCHLGPQSKVDLRQFSFSGYLAEITIREDILRSQWNMLADVMEKWKNIFAFQFLDENSDEAFGNKNNWSVCKIPSPIGLRILKVFHKNIQRGNIRDHAREFFPAEISDELMDIPEDDLEMMGPSDLEEMYPDYFN